MRAVKSSTRPSNARTCRPTLRKSSIWPSSSVSRVLVTFSFKARDVGTRAALGSPFRRMRSGRPVFSTCSRSKDHRARKDSTSMFFGLTPTDFRRFPYSSSETNALKAVFSDLPTSTTLPAAAWRVIAARWGRTSLRETSGLRDGSTVAIVDRGSLVAFFDRAEQHRRSPGRCRLAFARPNA